MSERPPYGTAMIRCATRGCTWRGYETERLQVPSPKFAGCTEERCPKCKKPGYYFLEQQP